MKFESLFEKLLLIITIVLIITTTTLGQINLLHEFSGGGSDGRSPYASLTMDGSTELVIFYRTLG